MVEAARGIGGEVFARAVLDEAAVVEHDDLIDPVERRQAVGDDDRGAAGEQPIGGRDEPDLGLGVQAAGCLVEDDQSGIGEQEPGEGEQLALAADSSVSPSRWWSSPCSSEWYQSPRPTVSIASTTSASVPSRVPNTVRLSRTLARNTSTSCVTMPIRRRRPLADRSRTSMPPTDTVPSSVSHSRASSRPIVVLPLPVRPTTPTVVPAGTANVMSWSTSVPVP